MSQTTPSYGSVLREVPQIIADYVKAQQRGVSFSKGYLNAAIQCAERSKGLLSHYSQHQVPPGTVTRTFGTSCSNLVALLVHTHSFASNAVLNQEKANRRFCHAATFNRLRQVVATTVITTGQERLIYPDTGHSLGMTVRSLTLEVPKFEAKLTEERPSMAIRPRPERAILTIAASQMTR